MIFCNNLIFCNAKVLQYFAKLLQYNTIGTTPDQQAGVCCLNLKSLAVE